MFTFQYSIPRFDMPFPTGTEPQAEEASPQAPDSTKVERGGPKSAIKYKDYKAFDRLAHILGLDTKADLGLSGRVCVKAWMASDSFKPAYDELVRDWIDSRWDKAVDGMTRKRAPKLNKIADAISKAPERYTSPTGVINKEGFGEIDHYALCLVRLRTANDSNPNGLFVGKTCSQEQKDKMLWQAMMRGGAEAWRVRKRRNRLSAVNG